MSEIAGDEQEVLILQSVERFLDREVRPVVHALEAADTYPAAIVEKLRTLGLFGATIAPEFGGLGLPAVTYARIVERMSRKGKLILTTDIQMNTDEIPC